MAKDKKRAGGAGDEDGEYKFPMPNFDEKAFIRREKESSKATFMAVGLGALAGVLAYAVNRLAGADQWYLGWLPIVGIMLALRAFMQQVGFSEDATQWKSMIGHFFMVFFTGLGVWILLFNVPGLA